MGEGTRKSLRYNKDIFNFNSTKTEYATRLKIFNLSIFKRIGQQVIEVLVEIFFSFYLPNTAFNVLNLLLICQIQLFKHQFDFGIYFNLGIPYDEIS